MAFITFLEEFPMQTETASRNTWETQISNGFNNPYTRELEPIRSKQTIIHSKLIKLI